MRFTPLMEMLNSILCKGYTLNNRNVVLYYMEKMCLDRVLLFRLCASYPEKILVPSWVTDTELENVAAFRSWKRIPAVVYRCLLA